MRRISPKQLWVLLAGFLLLFGCSLNPLVLEEQFQRRIDPPSLLERDSAELKEFNSRFEQSLQLAAQRTELANPIENPRIHEIKLLEAFMRSEITYESDIVQYFAIDHLATATEVLASSMDDCDGRAILATSLLLQRGYDAWVVMSWTHWWTEIQFTDGSTLQILTRGYNDAWLWYMKFNDSHIIFRGSRMLGYILYNFFLAALIPLLIPRLYNNIPKNINVRLLLRFMFLLWFIPLSFILVIFNVLG